MTTPLQVAVNMAESGDPEARAYAVAMLARALSDPDPADPLRLPWTVDVAVKRSAQFLHLNPTPELLARALELMPDVYPDRPISALRFVYRPEES